MINTDAIIFYLIGIIIITFFFRIVFLNIKVRRYIKKNHQKFWENNIHLFWGGAKAGPNIFQLAKVLSDPKIEKYKIDWDKALRQLLVAVLFIVLLLGVYVWLTHKT